MTSASDITYLLFIVPGFVLVWTYLHFTEQKMSGDFEYAGWSFVWGTILFMLFGLLANFIGRTLPPIPLTDLGSFVGTLTGMGVALALFAAFPVGYLIAYTSKRNLWKTIDSFLKNLLKKDLFK